jgi:hypothetical protein
MDRRSFLTGVGTLGAAAVGAASVASNEAGARAAGLAKAAGAPGPLSARLQGLPGASRARGIAMGTLEGDPTVLSARAAGGERLRWTMPPSTSLRAFLATAPAQEGRVSVMLGSVRTAGAVPLFRSIDVVAHFALEDGGFAPFYASSFRAAGGGRNAMSSPPVVFDALVPDRVALQIDYVLDSRAIDARLAPTGSLYLPLGASARTATGVYVIAGPSATTGLPPDLASYLFTGDVRAPIVDASGDAPGFDHLAFSVHAA